LYGSLSLCAYFCLGELKKLKRRLSGRLSSLMRLLDRYQVETGSNVEVSACLYLTPLCLGRVQKTHFRVQKSTKQHGRRVKMRNNSHTTKEKNRSVIWQSNSYFTRMHSTNSMYQLQKKYRYDIHKAYIIDQNQFFLSELSLNGVM
jgi:hypothetical protein